MKNILILAVVTYLVAISVSAYGDREACYRIAELEDGKYINSNSETCVIHDKDGLTKLYNITQ